jgi:hypothetical protein
MCGHYSFTDGQHRLCIASKKGLKLRAEVHHNDGVCGVCYREKKIQESIRIIEGMVSQTTPKKTIFNRVFMIEPKSCFQNSLDSWKQDLIDYQSEKERDFREF